MKHVVTLSLVLALGLPLQAQDKKATQAKGQEQGPSQKVEVKAGKKQGEAYKKFLKDQARQAQEEAKRKAIDEKIRKTRARLKKQGVLQSHVQVKVTLRNGEVMRGVVKNGLFVEKPTRLEFVRAEMKVAGAGVRLWYYNGTSGFIFLPYRTIRTYKILRRMTEIEVATLHDKMTAQKKVAKADGKDVEKAIEKKRDDVMDKLAKKKADVAQKEKSAAELKELSIETKLRALLQEYPPDEGWGPEKANEIRMRFINVGVPPDAKSKRFIDNLSDWKKAYAKYANELGKDGKDKSGSKPKTADPSPLK